MSVLGGKKIAGNVLRNPPLSAHSFSRRFLSRREKGPLLLRGERAFFLGEQRHALNRIVVRQLAMLKLASKPSHEKRKPRR